MSFLRSIAVDVWRTLLLFFFSARFVVGPLLRRVARRDPDLSRVGDGIRRVIEHMGITYRKLGQFMAMRPDLIPPEICKSLERLFENAAPMPWPVVRATIEAELKRPVGELFRQISREPIAAASVAQVHQATTTDGDRVAVKVQRPGVRETLRSDIRNFRRLARVADWLEIMGEISVLRVIEEFASFTDGELDFVAEGITGERLARGTRAGAYVPRIYWSHTASRVLTMEFIDGISVSQALTWIEEHNDAALARAVPGHDIGDVIRAIATASFQQLFITGFFHGDPHPGNVLIRRDGVVVYVDFGIFGQLSPEQRHVMSRFVESVALGNIDQAYWYCARLSEPTNRTDVLALRRETIAVLTEWYRASQDPRASFNEKHLGRYFGMLIGLMRKFRVRMGVDLVLFWRTLLLLDAVAIRVAERFDLAAYMREFFESNSPSMGERVRGLLGDKTLGAQLRAVRDDGARRLREARAAGRQPGAPRVSLEGSFDDRSRTQVSLRWGLMALAALAGLIAWTVRG